MAFNPALPQTNTPMSSAEMRGQFNGLDEKYAAAIAGCARNTTGVEWVDVDISDPPTKLQVEAIRDKINELLDALYRG